MMWMLGSKMPCCGMQMEGHSTWWCHVSMRTLESCRLLAPAVLTRQQCAGLGRWCCSAALPHLTAVCSHPAAVVASRL